MGESVAKNDTGRKYPDNPGLVDCANWRTPITIDLRQE
jgi:hypothetical protein